ncbi:MAG: hypothetical protein IK083_05990 [Abditibacteriota bacterium]|nr:hypothetical protein [Abditibacteriota bacterium]
MKTTLLSLLLLIFSAACFGSLLAPAGSADAEPGFDGAMTAGRAYRISRPGLYSGLLTYEYPDGKKGSRQLFFRDECYFIPYANLSGVTAEAGVTIERLQQENLMVYNGSIYSKPSVKKEQAKPDKVWKTSDGRLGLGVLKNGSLTLNADFRRRYFHGESGLLCQAPGGLYKLDSAETGDDLRFSAPEINALVTLEVTSMGQHLRIRGTLGPLDPARPCAAETVALHVPVGASASSPWGWMDSLNTVTAADGLLQELQERPRDAGYFLPLAFMFSSKEDMGLALALEPGPEAAGANLSYNGALGSMYAVFPAEAGRAGFALDLSEHPCEWGMREALDYYVSSHKSSFEAASGSPDSIEPSRISLVDNSSYRTVRGSLDRLSDRELLFVRVMAGRRPVYYVPDRPDDEEAAARALALGFITAPAGEASAAVRRYGALAEQIGALPWQRVPGASTNNPAVTVERFGGDEDDKYYIVCRNTRPTSQPAVVTIFTLPMAKVTVKEIVNDLDKTADSGVIKAVFLPGEVLIYEVENKWRK